MCLQCHHAPSEPAKFYRDRASDYPQMSVGHVTHPGCLNFIVESRKRSFSSMRHSDAQVVSSTAKEHSLSTCYRSVAIMKAGMKQADVTTHISVFVRNIKIWLSRDRTSEPFRSRAVAEASRR